MSPAWEWLRGAFFENVALKAFAFAFAIGLFAYLHGQEDPQLRTVPVGVVLRLPTEEPARRELMTPIPASIHVTVRGSARAIDALMQTGVPPVEIDLRDSTSDSITFAGEMFQLPPGIGVTIVDPPSISLAWQDVISRQVPVQASVTGRPTEGFVVKGEPEVDPKVVTASGPRSLVEVIQHARLAAFEASGLTEGTHQRLLAIDPPPGRVSWVGPGTATVTVVVARRVSEVRFEQRPVEVVGVANGKSSPRTVDVTVIGPPEIVRALRPEQVVPRADLSTAPGVDVVEQKHGSAQVRVLVDLEQATAEIQPPTVTVRW
ncbi:MAG: YbbR-like domain-containing protein [Polyangiaceae bacterium]|nr:YbbR-like domain-containing protein [Polyangiaceae bacterium]